MEWFLGTTRGVTPTTTFGWPEERHTGGFWERQWLDAAVKAMTGAMFPDFTYVAFNCARSASNQST